MNKIQEKFEKWKIEREVDDHNESYAFREGYVKAMRDAINLVKNNVDLGSVSLDWEFIDWIDKYMWSKYEHVGSLERQELWFDTFRYSAMENPLTNIELYEFYKSTIDED